MRTPLRHFLLGLAFTAGLGASLRAAEMPARLPDPVPSTLEEHPMPVDLTPPAKELGGHTEKHGESEGGEGGHSMTHTTVHASEGEGEGEAGILTSFEYLIQRPRRRGMDFAVRDPILDTVPQGRIQNVDWEMRSGFRIGLGYRLPSGWEVLLAYTYLHSSGGQQIVANQGGNLYATLARPGTSDVVSGASAAAAFNYNVFDLDFAKSYRMDKTLTVKILGGVRLATIDQNLGVLYNGLDAMSTNISQKISFDGAGPTVGGEATWTLGESGFSLFSRARGGLLYGNFRVQSTQTSFGSQVLEADISDRYASIVPVLQLGLGMGYNWRNVYISAGYEVVNYFNMVDYARFVDDYSEAKYVNRTSDLSLNGLFFQIGLTY